jgi:hypothetical protein
MAFRDGVLPLVDAARAQVSALGLRQTRVFLRTRAWSGDALGPEPGVGFDTIEEIEILPTPKVVELEGSDTVIVGPITPAYTGGGYTIEQLQGGPSEPARSYYYRLDGPRGSNKYTLGAIDTARPFRYTLRLRVIEASDPIADF